jgi:hypothetical protein
MPQAIPARGRSFQQVSAVANLLLPQFLLALFYPLPAFRRIVRRVDANDQAAFG